VADPFVGEIRIFPFGIVPQGWAPCEGQLLAISQNTALFSLLGTMYGGNGINNFQLPDLRGRLPLGYSANFPQGEFGGEETHTLTTGEMPAHTHPVQACSPAGTLSLVGNNYWAGSMNYSPAPTGPMAPGSVSSAGGGQAHANMQPYLALNFCIALNGIYPPRN
jgi:microcystin-dependent protein